jgi:lysozyme family protein
MASFEKAFDFMLENEGGKKATGGYQKWENDNGNWTGGRVGVGHLVGTKYGLTAPEISEALGHTATEQDVRDFPFEKVKPIYRKKYWNPIWGDRIADDLIAGKIFDTGVNLGTGVGIRFAHEIAGLPLKTTMDEELLTALNQLT